MKIVMVIFMCLIPSLASAKVQAVRIDDSNSSLFVPITRRLACYVRSNQSRLNLPGKIKRRKGTRYFSAYSKEDLKRIKLRWIDALKSSKNVREKRKIKRGYQAHQEALKTCRQLRSESIEANYYVDQSLAQSCPAGGYSIEKRDCSGQRGPAFKTIQEAVDAAQPGESILVRRGEYRDVGVRDTHRGLIAVRFKRSGLEGSPIVLKAFPGEKALIDGSDPLPEWQPCISQEQCLGNENWQNIYFAPLPEEATYAKSQVFEGDLFAAMAMSPNPPDPFYWEVQNSAWRPIAYASWSQTSITDPEIFREADVSYWMGAHVLIWGCNNNIFDREITAYDPASGKISFESWGSSGCLPADEASYVKKPNIYALRNHSSCLDKQNEYYFDERGRRLFYWPTSTEKLAEVRIGVRDKGIDFRGFDNLTVDGFTVSHFADQCFTNYTFGQGFEVSGITVRRNEVQRCRNEGIALAGASRTKAEYNRVHDVSEAGIFLSGGSGNAIVHNQLERVGGTGLRFYGVTDGTISFNSNINSRGQHANGITAYLECNNIVIEGNYVDDSNIPLTFQSSSNIYVRKNIFRSRGMGIAGWNGLYKGGNPTNIVIENNTVLGLDGGDGYVYVGSDFRDVLARDNILAGLGAAPNITHHHNLFQKLVWTQTYKLADYNESYEPDENLIFVNPAQSDYHPRNRGLIGQPPVSPCTMSSTGSYVGALSCGS